MTAKRSIEDYYKDLRHKSIINKTDLHQIITSSTFPSHPPTSSKDQINQTLSSKRPLNRLGSSRDQHINPHASSNDPFNDFSVSSEDPENDRLPVCHGSGHQSSLHYDLQQDRFTSTDLMSPDSPDVPSLHLNSDLNGTTQQLQGWYSVALFTNYLFIKSGVEYPTV